MRTHQWRLIVCTLGFVALNKEEESCIWLLMQPQMFVVIASQIMVEKVCARARI
jgi:hypothetical protein